jgi:hypothetical protein
MEFVLMRLTFSDPPSGESSAESPVFSPVTEFRTTGVVMNIFLLDPSERLLSAFVWVSTTNTIGLYALLDWNEPEYAFIDTGIDYVRPHPSFTLLTINSAILCRPRQLIGPVFFLINISSFTAKNPSGLINTFTLSHSFEPI